MPRFSVIIPVYKVEEYLRECVDSILNQEYTDFEVILIDDGSPDNCPRICDEYAEKDSRVKVIHKQNSGVSDSRNRGIEAAEGEYLWFVDSDDYIVDEAFTTALKHIEQRPDIIKFRTASVKEKDRSTIKIDPVVFSGTFSGEKKEDLLNQSNTNGILPYCWSNIYKTSFIKDTGIKFDTRLSYGEDSVFNFEAFFRAEEILFSEDCLYVYRSRKNSVSKKTEQNFDYGFVNQIELNCRLRDEIFEKYSKHHKKEYYYNKSEFVLVTVYQNILLTRIRKSRQKRSFFTFKKVSKTRIIQEALNIYDIDLIKSKSLDWYILWAIKHRLYFIGYLIFIYLTSKRRRKK